jgi:hypothetical protein
MSISDSLLAQTEQCLENIVFAAAASPNPGATQLASQAGR